MKLSIPKEVTDIIATLTGNGFDAYVVGGSVRDLLFGAVRGGLVEPKDWDVATRATPEEIQKLFPDSVYENEFGTVIIKTGSDDKSLAVVEVTTFRKEEKYSDFRHPDKITFTKSINEDLARRDFTINAIAISKENSIVDPFDGQNDLREKVVRAVGDPEKRFSEDALRLMRAVRFAAELGFEIEEKTEDALMKSANLMDNIAKERVRDELVKILMSSGEGAKWGIEKLEELGLLAYIIPELREGIGMTQNKHHTYTVWEHNILSLDYAAKKKYTLQVRLAALLHDVGKPRTKDGEGPNATFYNHEIVGAKMAREVLDRLHFPKAITKEVTHLIRYHMFYYNVDEVTAAGVRRFVRRVGADSIPDLIKLREADRIGSGVPKAVPYKLRHFLFMIEKVKRDPISPKMLKLKGDDIMKLLNLEPGPKIGWILVILLEEVLDDPNKNEEKFLEARAKELGELSDKELEKNAKKAQEKKGEFESGLEGELKRKYHVK